MDISYGSATKRIAFVNLNWDIIDSSDVFAICESIVDNIEVVKICKSKKFKETHSDVKPSSKREYKEEKLKFIKNKYIGVIECNTLEDSIKIYKELDGNEIENSGMYFDLRFIPEDYVLGEVCNECRSSDGYVVKDFNKINESYEARKRKMLLNQLFSSKNVKKELLSQIISLSDEDDKLDDTENTEESVGEVKGSRGKKSDLNKSNSTGITLENDTVNNKEIVDESTFTFNRFDQRFSSLYTNEDFIIDPSDPEYKKNNDHLSLILKEKRNNYKEEI